MKKLFTPYACGICKTEFGNPICLVKHAELRHPTKSRQFSTFSNTNIETIKTNVFSEPKEKSDNSKNNNKSDSTKELITKSN